MFAPHYAEPLPCTLSRTAPLTGTRDAEPLGELGAGEPFEVLEVAGDRAWGLAPGPGLAGYVPADALAAG